MAEPIVIFYKSKGCGVCTTVSKIWDASKASMRKVKPGIRFEEIETESNNGIFDRNKWPKDLLRFAKWFPMILLVPGRIWDAAMAKLDTPLWVKDGIQVMNAEWVQDPKTGADLFQYGGSTKYDVKTPDSFGEWLKAALQVDTFKQVQAGIIKPVTSVIARPIAVTKQTPSHGSNRRDDTDMHNNLCTMNLISRTK